MNYLIKKRFKKIKNFQLHKKLNNRTNVFKSVLYISKKEQCEKFYKEKEKLLI